MNIFNNPNLIFLPILIFSVLLLSGLLIGFWNGWKTALYFMAWNWIAAITAILVIAFAWDSIIGIIPKMGDINIKELANANKFILEPVVGVVVTVISILIANLLAFSLYWIFRSKLKRSIKQNKARNVSNLPSRFIGASIGVATVAPLAIFATSTSSVLVAGTNYRTSTFSKLSDKMTTGITIGRYRDVSDAFAEIYNLGNAATKISEIKNVFGQIFGVFDATDPNATIVDPNIFDNPDNKKAVESILNSKMLSIATINSILPEDLRPGPDNQIDFAELTQKFMNDPHMNDNKFTTPIHIENIYNVANIILTAYSPQGNKDPEVIISFFETIGLITPVNRKSQSSILTTTTTTPSVATPVTVKP